MCQCVAPRVGQGSAAPFPLQLNQQRLPHAGAATAPLWAGASAPNIQVPFLLLNTAELQPQPLGSFSCEQQEQRHRGVLRGAAVM